MAYLVQARGSGGELVAETRLQAASAIVLADRWQSDRADLEEIRIVHQGRTYEVDEFRTAWVNRKRLMSGRHREVQSNSPGRSL